MRKFVLLMVVIFLASCAPKAKPRYPTTRPSEKPPEGSREPPITTPAEELTPERMASNSLIEEGEQALERGLNDRAADLFQQSITVDPTNGAGYYYLAFVKTKSGEYGEAWDLFEKAESLLSRDPDWTSKLDDLRQELRERR